MSATEQTIINQTKISEQVYEYLHRSIVTGRFTPGQRLNLDELEVQLKISKMPIKEAIGRLAAEGLLDIQARRGTYVGRIDPRDLAETFEVRRALEMLAGELAVNCITKAEIGKLRNLIIQMEASHDVAQHLELNFEFHSLIVELSNNRKLIETYHRLRVPIQVAGIHFRSEDWVSRIAQEQKEHRTIVRALEQKDAEAVSRAISEHIKRGSTSLLEDVERSIKQNA